MVGKVWEYYHSFRYNARTWQTDTQTDRHTDGACFRRFPGRGRRFVLRWLCTHFISMPLLIGRDHLRAKIAQDLGYCNKRVQIRTACIYRLADWRDAAAAAASNVCLSAVQLHCSCQEMFRGKATRWNCHKALCFRPRNWWPTTIAKPTVSVRSSIVITFLTWKKTAYTVYLKMNKLEHNLDLYSASIVANTSALSPLTSPSARHQPTLQDHGLRASVSRDVPVYFPSFRSPYAPTWTEARWTL